MQLSSICTVLQHMAPTGLAESWDNVGLLVGDRESDVKNILTCLTITPAVVDEAIDKRIDLIVAHHPLPFQPVAKLTTDTVTGRLLWRLAKAGIAVYSAHTAYDSAAGGMNDQWCAKLGIPSPRPLNELPGEPLGLGSGRYGDLETETTAVDFLNTAAKTCGSTRPRLTGDPARMVRRIGVACGSGGSFVAAARRRGCDLLLTGEATFHQCLEADNSGMTLAMVGHHASEWFGVVSLATTLGKRLAELRAEGAEWSRDGVCTPSETDLDPIAVDPPALKL